MRCVVMKFGGSSVVDAPAIGRVISLVEAERSRGGTPVVVVSAMGGVTDELLALLALPGAAAGEQLDAVAERHVREGARLAADDPPLLLAIQELVEGARVALRRAPDGQTPDPHTQDVVAATGELLSSRVIAAAMAAKGLPAAWIDARNVIVTDDRHGTAVPLRDETNAAVRRVLLPILASGVIPVIGGFVGGTRDGVTTTLGRGGSDYSASLVGAALEASEIQIWTDVDGMLTADPRVVAGAEVVPHLSFEEAAELAYFGAKVLHPSTIFPAVASGIPVRILNSQRPSAGGTLIGGQPAPVAGGRPLAALAGKRGITVIDITSTRMLMAHGFLQRVFAVFERYATAVDVVTTSEVSVSVTVDDPRRLPEIVVSLGEVAEVTVDRDMAILSVVGDSLRAQPSLAPRIVGALADFPLRMVSQAASRRNLTMVLPDVHLAPAMAHLHREFFAVAGAGR